MRAVIVSFFNYFFYLYFVSTTATDDIGNDFNLTYLYLTCNSMLSVQSVHCFFLLTFKSKKQKFRASHEPVTLLLSKKQKFYFQTLTPSMHQSAVNFIFDYAKEMVDPHIMLSVFQS